MQLVEGQSSPSALILPLPPTPSLLLTSDRAPPSVRSESPQPLLSNIQLGARDEETGQISSKDGAVGTARLIEAARWPRFVNDCIDELLNLSVDSSWQALLVNWVNFEVLVLEKGLKVCVFNSPCFHYH